MTFYSNKVSNKVFSTFYFFTACLLKKYLYICKVINAQIDYIKKEFILKTLI